jgi:hypothetical protein
LHNLEILLDFLEHPNIRVSYKFFGQNRLFSSFVGSFSGRMPIFGMVSWILILNNKKILFGFLDHPNIRVSCRFFGQNRFFSSFLSWISILNNNKILFGFLEHPNIRKPKICDFYQNTCMTPNVRVLQKSKKYFSVINIDTQLTIPKISILAEKTDVSRKIAIFAKILIWHPNERVLQKSKKYVLVIKYPHSANHTKNWHSSRKNRRKTKKSDFDQKTCMTL